jgi:hypothetical protein
VIFGNPERLDKCLKSSRGPLFIASTSGASFAPVQVAHDAEARLVRSYSVPFAAIRF